MSRRVLGVLGAAIAGLGALLVWRQYYREDRPIQQEGRVAGAVAIDELRSEVTRLRGEVAAVQLQRGSRKAEEPPPALGQPRGEPSPAKGEVPVERPTREEQISKFESYFAILDAKRGSIVDGSLTDRFRTALTAPRPEFTLIKAENVALVTCGNGLCRAELQFPTYDDARAARGEIAFRIGPLSSDSTMYMNPERKTLTAYFAVPGTPLPAFPATEK